MQDSVLNLGEKIALAARLAAIEHVRQMLEHEQHDPQQGEQQGERRTGPGGARANRFKDEPASQPLQRLGRAVLSGLVMPAQPARLQLRGAA
jgi:hypothetical protein